MIPKYRVWAGMGLWIGGTAIDAYLTLTYSYPDEQMRGMLSLAGFMLAFAWAQTAPK